MNENDGSICGYDIGLVVDEIDNNDVGCGCGCDEDNDAGSNVPAVGGESLCSYFLSPLDSPLVGGDELDDDNVDGGLDVGVGSIPNGPLVRNESIYEPNKLGLFHVP